MLVSSVFRPPALALLFLFGRSRVVRAVHLINFYMDLYILKYDSKKRCTVLLPQTFRVAKKWRIVHVNASVYAIVAALSSFRRMQR